VKIQPQWVVTPGEHLKIKVRTLQEMRCFVKTNRFTENNTVGCENYLTHINRLCGQDTGRRTLNQVITGYSNRRALTRELTSAYRAT
jgi:hypothetical protein